MTFLLDTNVVSEIRRNRDPHVRAWAKAVDEVDLHLSVMTLGEIRKGTELLMTGKVGAEVSLEGAQWCAQVCMLQALAQRQDFVETQGVSAFERQHRAFR